MPKKTYHVCLSPEEEKLLRDITHKGNSHSAKKILHANILLLTNECYPDKRRSNQEVADIFGVSKTTVNQVRKTYAEHGIEAALTRKTPLRLPLKSRAIWKRMCWQPHSVHHQKAMQDGHCVSWQNIVWRTSIWYPFPILLLGICSIQMN
jgi:hypothetical protein